MIDHCEEPTLTEKAPMNEGPVATLLGLRGWPGAAETVMVERDMLLAELTGGKRAHRARLDRGLGRRRPARPRRAGCA